MARLTALVSQRAAKVAVVGLGYVGLPLAACFASVGFPVTGVDHDRRRVARVTKGESPLAGEEPGLAEALARAVRGGRLTVTAGYGALAEADVILIAVDTPVEADKRPAYRALRETCEAVGAVMKEGALVVVESTVAPGTMDQVVAPLLEEASGRRRDHGFFVGHCPERVMPGRLLRNLTELSRVCGGGTPDTSRAMVALYRTIVEGELDEADCVTAELVKTAENTYRDVNIAFANELAMICEASGGAFLRVRELVNKAPGRSVLLAGAGVGGHCLTKDPWLLAHGAPHLSPTLIAAARARNDAMPAHVLTLVSSALAEAGRALTGARLAVLGASYLEGSGDARHAPTGDFVAHAHAAGATCVIHDPYVEEHQGELAAVLRGADAVVLLVAHAAYTTLDLGAVAAALRTKVLVDARHVIAPDAARAAGLVIRSLGAAPAPPAARHAAPRPPAPKPKSSRSTLRKR